MLQQAAKISTLIISGASDEEAEAANTATQCKTLQNTLQHTATRGILIISDASGEEAKTPCHAVKYTYIYTYMCILH